MTIPRIFVGSASESLPIAEAVQVNLQEISDVRIWNQGLFPIGSSTLDNLISIVDGFDFAIFVVSNNDTITMRGETFPVARDNVYFEAGAFYSALGKDRVFLLVETNPTTKLPSDLYGITIAPFRKPTDGNYEAAIAPALVGVKKQVNILRRREVKARIHVQPQGLEPIIYQSRRAAWDIIKEDCKQSRSISVLANRGVIFFGTDDSIVSLAELDEYTQLQKIRIVLLSRQSRWIHEGYVLLRSYESLDLFQRELEATHLIVESEMRRFGKIYPSTKSGVRYHVGEPHFRMIMTDTSAYVSSYAEPPRAQAKDLPVYRFDKSSGSLYGALKRYFDDLWHNHTVPGVYEREVIDLETSAGGIVVCYEGRDAYYALLQRHDGYWVLPKGHKMVMDKSLDDTAIREVCEETGLFPKQLNIEGYLGHYSFDETIAALGIHKVVHLYLFRFLGTKRPELKSPDHAGAKWWSFDEPLPRMQSTYQETYVRQIIEDHRLKSEPRQ